MDGSNGNNPSTGGGSGGGASNAPTQQPRTPPHPGDSSRAVRAELEAQRRAKVEKQRHYWPLVKQQIERVFGDTQPAWYARLRLFTPAMYAAVAGNRVLSLSTQKDRLLSDAEARALTEHAARSSDRLALIDWGLTGVAAYFTWRGRRTLRFPMWTPQMVLSPPGSYLGMTMWHGARYVAYLLALTVTVKAPLVSLNLMSEARQTFADERLRGVLGRQDGQDSAAGEWGKAGAARDSESSSYRASAGGEDAQQQRQRQSIQEAAQSGWNTSKQTEQSPPLPTPPPQQQQQPRQYGQSAQSQGNASWGSSYSQSPSSSSSSAGWGSDDFDDASPVAASAQNSSRSGNSAAGSTWERLRQQARSGPQQRQQQQQVQPHVQQQHWGDAGDGADRAAQEQAQRDFDRLVERDRQGRSSR
ncbi:hypothetical protein MY10362_002498 [Beauveria mimosiformis]